EVGVELRPALGPYGLRDGDDAVERDAVGAERNGEPTLVGEPLARDHDGQALFAPHAQEHLEERARQVERAHVRVEVRRIDAEGARTLYLRAYLRLRIAH